jgi:hypothetical protein
VPGLNAGGWHDAGDYDLRVESQAETVYKLALAYELFHDEHDQTSIDQGSRRVRLHVPDGKPDILQQIEHGVLSIVGGYESLGRLYRGIICPTLEQYTHLGDAATMSDNVVFGGREPVSGDERPKDDRLVFTETNPRRELYVAQALAAAHRVLRTYNPPLSRKCLEIAHSLYRANADERSPECVNAVAELFLSTEGSAYRDHILLQTTYMIQHIQECCEVLGRVVERLRDTAFTRAATAAVRAHMENVIARQRENPYRVPYRPHIWGAGWGIQSFGVRQLLLHMGFADIVPPDYAMNALSFVLGCHPGENTASFVSGVGAHSLTVAYGTNRDDWSYIPGGVASGTALIRPDLPELKVWPYFWQQTEYVIGGGTVDFMLLAMAADAFLNKRR